MEFTKTLNRLMKERGLSLSELAKGTGMAKSTLHNLLNGTEPSLGKAQLLSRFFNVSLDYLVTGQGNSANTSEGEAVYKVIIKRVNS